jgi:hypothetical protein
MSEKPRFVRTVADDLRIADRLEVPQAFFPHYALAIQSIGPERALHMCATRFKPKSDEVVEVSIRQSFDVEESWGALELYRRGPDNVNLVLFNRQGFEFVVIPDYLSGAVANFF